MTVYICHVAQGVAISLDCFVADTEQIQDRLLAIALQYVIPE